MRPSFRKMKSAGLPPGSLIHTGRFHQTPVVINAYDYQGEEFKEYLDTNLEQVSELKKLDRTIWIQVIGVHNAELISEIGALFKIEPLVLEDIMNTNQRTKLESYPQYDFIVQNIPYPEPDAEERRLTTEQISMISFPKNWIISFQERKTSVFDALIARVRTGTNRLRNLGAPYLAYSLLDSTVDSFFPVLDSIFETAENLEDEIIRNPQKNTLSKTHILRQNLGICRKCIWATREFTGNIIRDSNAAQSTEMKLFYRDIYDHAHQLIDSIEALREMTLSLVDSYMNQLSLKMNEIMKILTIISTIFIPLSFISGLYGMNFNTEISSLNMPELNWAWGYPIVLGLMLITATGLLFFFKRKNWF